MKKLHSRKMAKKAIRSDFFGRSIESAGKSIIREEVAKYKSLLHKFKKENKEVNVESAECWRFVDYDECDMVGTLDECLCCFGFSNPSTWRNIKLHREEAIRLGIPVTSDITERYQKDEDGDIDWEQPPRLMVYCPDDVDKLIVQDEIGYERHKGILLRQGITYEWKHEYMVKSICFNPQCLEWKNTPKT
jgi:hypothetical protein